MHESRMDELKVNKILKGSDRFSLPIEAIPLGGRIKPREVFTVVMLQFEAGGM